MTIVLLAALAGCHSGKTSVESSSDAPFSLADVKATIMGVDPDNDTHDGMALMILSDQDVSCGEMSSLPMGGDLDSSALYDLVDNASGLMFLFRYYDYEVSSSEATPQDISFFEGLWTGLMIHYTEDDDLRRTMMALGFSDGYLMLIDGYYSYYLGSDSWVDIRDISDDSLSGAYHTRWWSGDFNATYCGAWQPAPETHDTWDWDSY